MKKRLGLVFAGVLVSVSAGCSASVDAGESAAVAPSSEDESNASTVVPEEQNSISMPETETELAIVVPQAAPLLHTWTNASAVGEALEVPSSDVERCQHLHLDLCEAGVSCAEVVCWLSDEYFHVGSSVCPACEKDQLACDGKVLRCTTCRAEFDLLTCVSSSGDSSDIRMTSVPFGSSEGALRVASADVIRAVDYALGGEEVAVSKVEAAVEEESVDIEQEDERDLPSCCG